MRYSVVIPSFNRADCIGRTIDAVLAQSHVPHEVIVVDDGSTDDTGAVVARYGDRVRCVSQPNGGVALARNQGAALATGEWLAFVDSDDLWHRRKLEFQLGVLAQLPEARWSVTGCNIIDPDDHEIPGREGFEAVFPVFGHEGRSAEALFAEYLERRDVTVGGERLQVSAGDAYLALFLGNFGLPSSLVMARDLYADLGGFNPSLRLSEDTEFFHRAAERSPVAILMPALVGYRVGRAGSLISPANSERLIENALASLDASRARRPADPRVDALWQRGRRRLLDRLAYTRLSNFDGAGTRRAVRAAWQSGAPRTPRSLALYATSLLPAFALRGLHRLKRMIA
jgi:glycosyltransferase involved in cell wall biosynthesis